MLDKVEKFFKKEYRLLVGDEENKSPSVTSDDCWYTIQRCHAVYVFVLDLLDNEKDIDELNMIYQKYFEKFKKIY